MDDWNHQRELFLAGNGATARIPIIASHVDDSTMLYTSQMQVYYPSCDDNAVGVHGALGIATKTPSIGQLFVMRTEATKDSVTSHMVIRTDTMHVSSSSDSMSFILRREAGARAETQSWLGDSGRVTFTLAIRSAVTNNTLRILDTISTKRWYLDDRADTVAVSLGDQLDSAIYFVLTADTAHIATAVIAAATAIDDDDSVAEAALAKRALSHATHAAPVNPIFLSAYPMPATPSATIEFTVSDEDAGDAARVRILDVMGNTVETLVNDVRPAGTYHVRFDGGGLRAGAYFCEVALRNHRECRMIVVVK